MDSNGFFRLCTNARDSILLWQDVARCETSLLSNGSIMTVVIGYHLATSNSTAIGTIKNDLVFDLSSHLDFQSYISRCSLDPIVIKLPYSLVDPWNTVAPVTTELSSQHQQHQRGRKGQIFAPHECGVRETSSHWTWGLMLPTSWLYSRVTWADKHLPSLITSQPFSTNI